MSEFVNKEAWASVQLDRGAGGTRRACNTDGCLKEYEHTGPCAFESERPPDVTSIQTLLLATRAKQQMEPLPRGQAIRGVALFQPRNKPSKAGD